MSTELICAALGVRADRWPPDHYSLLGLSRGDVDPIVIEQHVLDRMERLRHYQLAHPDAVTDAMNRLAQALVCLSDPVAKAAYDKARGSRPVAEPAPVEDEGPPGPYALAAPDAIAAGLIGVPRASRPWHIGDEGRRSLYRRLGAARRLFAAWREVGDFIADTTTRWTLGPADAIEFVGALMELCDHLADEAAPAVALPGQPGALVAALARQSLPLSTYRQFLPEQRMALRADWLAGESQVAEAYRSLGQAVRRHHRTAPRRAARKLARSLVTDRLDLLLFVMGLAALGLAWMRSR